MTSHTNTRHCCHNHSKDGQVKIKSGDEVDEVTYTCPMHPQIKQNKPGNCPICGMALEPAISTNNDHFDKELGELKLHFLLQKILLLQSEKA